SSGAVASSIDNVVPGSYAVVVSDLGCNDTATFNLSGSGLIVTDTTRQLTCGNVATGRIALGVTGGAPPYSYQWSNGSTGYAVSNLQAGTYTVTISQSARGCLPDTLTYVILPVD